MRQAVNLKRLELLVVNLPRTGAFRSALSAAWNRRTLLLRWIDENGDWGIGECACLPDPVYTGEFLKGAVLVIRDHIFPRLTSAKSIGDVIRASSLLSRARLSIEASAKLYAKTIVRLGDEETLTFAEPLANRTPSGTGPTTTSSASRMLWDGWRMKTRRSVQRLTKRPGSG